MTGTAIEKILTLLLDGNYSTQEIATTLSLPLGTVRSTVSLIGRLGLVKRVPASKRGVPYEITEKGREYLKKGA